jgi:1-acyl-sn-glycerol-3-phosphate acyltransferase
MGNMQDETGKVKMFVNNPFTKPVQDDVHFQSRLSLNRLMISMQLHNRIITAHGTLSITRLPHVRHSCYILLPLHCKNFTEVPLKASFIRLVWVTFSAYVVGFYASLLNHFNIKGAAHIPASGGVLIASNHISAYETIFLPWAVLWSHPMQMLWAPAKEELFTNALQRLIYQSWGAFPVKRGRDVRAGKTINDLLSSQKVMLFPEGTRHKDGVLGKGNRGVGKIIYDTRPVVIPTALTGINRWKFPAIGQEGSVVFGAPLDFADLYLLEDCKETHQLIVDRVMSAIADLLKEEGAYVNES